MGITRFGSRDQTILSDLSNLIIIRLEATQCCDIFACTAGPDGNSPQWLLDRKSTRLNSSHT